MNGMTLEKMGEWENGDANKFKPEHENEILPLLTTSLPPELEAGEMSGLLTSVKNENGHEADEMRNTFSDDLSSLVTKCDVDEVTPLIGNRRRTVSFMEHGTGCEERPNISERFFNSLYRARSNLSQSIKLISKTESLALFKHRILLTQSLIGIDSMDRRASAFMTSMNILCLIQGVSIFAMPFVTVYGGIAVILSTFVIGFLNWYTTYLINECQYQVSRTTPGLLKRVYPTYIDIGKAVFPKYGAVLMKLTTLMTLVSGISFFILLGQTTYDLLTSFAPLSNLHWVLVWAVIVFPCLFVTRVSVMAWFSLVGLVCLTIVLLAAYVLLISKYSKWSLSNISWGFSLEYLMLGYGIIHNSYFLHLAVPSIEGSMKEPHHCNKSMAISFALNTIFKVGFQIIGALTFGSLINQSVTTNLSMTLGISILINVLTAINLYCSFPISLCVLFEMVDQYVLPHFTIFKEQGIRFYLWLMLSRGLILLFVVFIAVSVPQFSLVVSFLGNIRSSLLALILPLYFYLYLKWRHLNVVLKLVHIFLFCASCLLGIGATYFSLRAIITKLSS